MGFDLSNYVEVNTRIEKFWEKYPEGCISTEMLSWENKVIVMKVEVYRNLTDDFPAATGHAYENEEDGYINKTSALENCETSAVGRALAIMGFEVKKAVASREEVDVAIQKQNKLKVKKTTPKVDGRTSEAQIKNLFLEYHDGDKDEAKSDYEMWADMTPELQAETIANIKEKVGK